MPDLRKAVEYFDLNVRGSQVWARDALAVAASSAFRLSRSDLSAGAASAARFLSESISGSLSAILPKSRKKGASVREVTGERLPPTKETNHVEQLIAQSNLPEHRSPLSKSSQLAMYLGIFVGVLFSSLVTQFASGVNLSFAVPNLGRIAVSAVIALLIAPIAYEKLKLDPSSPFLVQLGLFVQNGVFWHVVITSIAKLE